MSKTPISTLQEYMAKQTLGLPIYTIISQTSGTHLASFTYRVICGNQSAEGTATSKKEAKHNAARKMLMSLSSCNKTTPTNSSLSPQKIVPADSYYSPGCSNNSHDNIFVNSVGKLQEHCMSSMLKTPEYTISNDSGPDHLKMFTITCSVGSLSAPGTANTKKQAKQNAAQNMYQMLMRTTTSKTNLNLFKTDTLRSCIEGADSKLRKVNILDLKMDEPSTPVAKSCEKAKELFPKLRYRDSVKIVKNIDVKDYHKSLKCSVTTGNRENAQKQLRILPDTSKEMVLNNVLDILNLRLECNTAVKQYGDCVVSCTLDSTPVITDVGIGKTIYEAKERAITNLLNSIDLLLK